MITMEMNKDILNLYFEGKASEKQVSEIRNWAESSEENMAALLSERKVFDSSILIGKQVRTNIISRHSVLHRFSRIAVAVVFVIGVTFGVNGYLAKRDREMTAMTTISVPSGQRVSMELPDGTSVWLNSGTTLKYPSDFKRSERREIHLDGMAYFDVARDEDHPFVVHTYLMDIEVLGTQFDVNVSSKRKIFETSLLKGKIQLSKPGVKDSSIPLEPDQKITLKDNRLRISKIEDYDIYRWKEGLYCFRNKRFTEIIEDLERYYDMDIRFINGHTFDKHILTGKFRISDGLDYAMKILQESVDFSYTREKNSESNIIHITQN